MKKSKTGNVITIMWKRYTVTVPKFSDGIDSALGIAKTFVG